MSQTLVELYTEILERYPQEYERDNKASNPYFADLKERLIKTFEPFAVPYGFSIKPLGGQGMMRKMPYVIILASGHKTSKGIYPSWFFDDERKTIRLGIGDSDDHEPPQELVDKFATRACELLPDFDLRNEDGYPRKVYHRDELEETVLVEDFKRVLETFQDCLDEFEESIQDFLLGPSVEGDRPTPTKNFDYNIQFLIDRFFEWFENNPHKQHESVDEYKRFSRDYFENLSDDELTEVIFQFAHDGGKIQSGGERTASTLRASINAQPDLFRQQILKTFNPDFDLEKWWQAMDAFKGFGKGIRSIFLHRIFPDKYGILNNKSKNCFKMLGFYPDRKPHGDFEYGLINEAAVKLISYRLEKMNFYRADAMTHFLLGTDDGKRLLDYIEKQSARRIWVIAAGNNGELWEEIHNDGIISIGWDFLGDLRNYESKSAIQAELQRFYSTSSSKKNDTLACYQFCNEMKIDDVVVIKDKLNVISGSGLVISDYYFDNSRSRFKHCRKIKLVYSQRVELPERYKFASKTLTDITPYDDFVNCILDLYERDHAKLDAQIKYEIEPYTREDALASLFISPEEFDHIINLLKYKKNIILQGPPGVGKSFMAKKLAYTLLGEKDESRMDMVQFHQSYSYEDFIQGFRPTDEGKFKLHDGVFYQFCQNARQHPKRDYVFIIDEINRGNLSKIFGELMLLIEADKRKTEFAMPLTYSDARKFFIPPNVHLIGLMNTADRSLAMVDYALRRRFAFVDLPPQFNEKFKAHLVHNGLSADFVDDIIDSLAKVNKDIADDSNLGWGYCLGHSFFCPAPRDSDYKAWFEQIIRYEIEPLLKEYWYDNADKVKNSVSQLKIIV